MSFRRTLIKMHPTKPLIVAGLVVMASLATDLARAEYLKRVCELKSEEKSSVVIKINRQEAFGYQGDLYYKGKHVAPFSTGQANGYGTVWWSTNSGGDSRELAGINRVVFFSGAHLFNPLRSVPPAEGIDRMLFVGLGSDLYYSPHKGSQDLLQAGEGMWRISKGCAGVKFRRGM